MAKLKAALMIFLCVVVAGITLSCSVPQNHLSPYQRSMIITNPEIEAEVLSRASVEPLADEGLSNIKVLHLQGTPYEMGYQHGALLKDDIQAMYASLFRRVKIFASEEMMDEVYDLMAPYIPIEEVEEMRGVAHGADVPLKLVHWIHAIPEVSEYGQKKRFRRGFQQTSCSNLAAFGKATADGELYQLRVLDWIRELGVQKWSVILVHHPDRGNSSVSFSYAGFIGTVSGMNDQQMAFGEMGYGDPIGESLEGIPFIFLFRKLMREADNLETVQRMLTEARRTSSYVYLVSDAKAAEDETRALLFITDRNRVLAYGENTLMIDERQEKKRKKVEKYLPIDDVVYGGAKGPVLHQEILNIYGQIAPDSLKEITKPVSLKSNMQNVIFKPATLETWVSNATGEKGEPGKASNQQWFHFDFADALAKHELLQEQVSDLQAGE